MRRREAASWARPSAFAIAVATSSAKRSRLLSACGDAESVEEIEIVPQTLPSTRIGAATVHPSPS